MRKQNSPFLWYPPQCHGNQSYPVVRGLAVYRYIELQRFLNFLKKIWKNIYDYGILIRNDTGRRGMVGLDFIVKTYEELTKNELYAILKARINVFVVEQHCPYPDLDGIDKQCLHIFSLDREGDCTAYLRAFLLEQGIVQLGRVLTVHRGMGHGGELLDFAVQTVIEHFKPKKLFIEAQTHAAGFYRREGFRVVSQEYEEDGIPHVQMEMEITGHEYKKIHINGDIEIPMELTEADFLKRFNGFIDANAWSFGGETTETVEIRYTDRRQPTEPERFGDTMLKSKALVSPSIDLTPPEGPIDISPEDEAFRRSRLNRSNRRSEDITTHRRRTKAKYPASGRVKKKAGRISGRR